MSGTAAQLRQLLYSRGRQARLGGIVAGSVLLAVTAAVVILAPVEYSVAALLVVPVGVLAWFGGVWTGRAGAVMGAVACVLADMANGRPLDGAVGVSAAALLFVLLVVAAYLPGLRFDSQSYRDHAQTDPLTNLGNRRFFREVALVELNRSKRYSRPVSLMYMDVDGFEGLRHERGHADADLLLVHLASVMSGALRTSDIVARISGAEFAILLPETDGTGARVVADKLRQRLVTSASEAGHDVTLRVAVVGTPSGPVSLEAGAGAAVVPRVRASADATGLIAAVWRPAGPACGRPNERKCAREGVRPVR
jgi:diguanylate cyclase (GGDEF)-like protein